MVEAQLCIYFYWKRIRNEETLVKHVFQFIDVTNWCICIVLNKLWTDSYNFTIGRSVWFRHNFVSNFYWKRIRNEETLVNHVFQFIDVINWYTFLVLSKVWTDSYNSKQGGACGWGATLYLFLLKTD